MLAPARYLRIRHSAKFGFDYGWPLILTVLSVALFMALPVRPAILGSDGFIKGLHDLIGLLAAFFVAALAAVSTVERKALDAPMLGTPPTLGGKPLSRRQFVCFLFGYLSMVAFVLYMASIVAEVVAPSLRAAVSPYHLGWLRTGLGSIYAFVFWNMATTTMLGIWFLIERVPMTMPEANARQTIDSLVVRPTWQAKSEHR